MTVRDSVCLWASGSVGVSVPVQRRKPPPLSSTIFSQPSSRLGTTPDQRVALGVHSRGGARKADRDVIVDDGLLTKDLESVQAARKNFKRFKKKGVRGSSAPAARRPVIKMRLHNADDLSRAIDQVGRDSDNDSDDNNLFNDNVPANRVHTHTHTHTHTHNLSRALSLCLCACLSLTVCVHAAAPCEAAPSQSKRDRAATTRAMRVKSGAKKR